MEVYREPQRGDSTSLDALTTPAYSTGNRRNRSYRINGDRSMDIAQLQTEYQTQATRAERLRNDLSVQLARLLADKQITLGVPMESRVKSLESISEKLQRVAYPIDCLTDLQDFIGFRLILLFGRDTASVKQIIEEHFQVIRLEDTAQRLDETQFGYQSIHYIVRISDDWCKVPTLYGLNDLYIEIQVRTLAQHIWAAASHKLQYKQESGVPVPVRRSIHRLSALLETVDLEFERMLAERETYIGTVDIDDELPDDTLNVDLLEKVLDEFFPVENKMMNEDYSTLLEELLILRVTNTTELQKLIHQHLKAAIERDTAIVELSSRKKKTVDTAVKPSAGVYFSHVGLMRLILSHTFREEYTVGIQKIAEQTSRVK